MIRRYLLPLLFISIIGLLGVTASPTEAANTKSGGFVRASKQFSYVANSLGIDGGNITIEAWAQFASLPNNTGSNLRRGIATQLGATTDVQYDLAFQHTGTAQFDFNRQKAGVGQSDAVYSTTPSTNTWYHVAGTYDGTNLRLYTAVEGGKHTLRATTAASGSGSGFNIPNCFAIAQLANVRASGDPCTTALSNTAAAVPFNLEDGLIDEVKVWNTVRTIDELDCDMNAEATGAETGLVAYYKMNDDWNDTTAGAFHLTASSTPTFSTTLPLFTPCASFNFWQFWDF